MQFRKIGKKFVIRLSRGEEIAQEITRFLKEQDVKAGNITGIGAVDYVKLRYFDISTKKYYGKEFRGKFEIASLTGNVSLMDGAPWPHLHIVLADSEYQCFGGHLECAIVSVTCEIMIDIFEEPVERAFDEETGLQLWSLS